MSREARKYIAVLLAVSVFAGGCKPVAPFYFGENPDMAHYVGVATSLEYPDVHEASLTETRLSEQPLSLDNPEPRKLWSLSLQEAVQISLTNSKVLKQLGGGARLDLASNQGAFIGLAAPPSQLKQFVLSPDSVGTVYDTALQETNVLSPATQGVESALADFDAQFSTSLFWDRVDRPQNANPNPIFPGVLQEDRMTIISELTKRTATGAQFSFRNNTVYTESNQPFRALPSDWLTNFEMEMRQPLMRGAGTQVNRVQVVLARIRTDITLADFECKVRNHVFDVEKAYWELYFAYRSLESQKQRRDIVHAVWRFVETTTRAGLGTTQSEALARQEYLEAKARVEGTLADLYKAENRLRYILGLAATDGRLIRPVDEPVSARVQFDWHEILCEALARSCELRIKRWQIKDRETRMITARNQLLPQMDAVALYRWLGAGDDLIRDGDNPAFPAPGSDAMEQLLHGDFQEWRLGFEFALPIGFRRELAGMRHAQLQLARERALLKETELECVHQLTDAVQNTHNWQYLAETNFNRQVATAEEVDAYLALIKGEIGRTGTRGISENLEFLLNAIRRDADAKLLFYRAVVNHTVSISEVHFRKGSLLEYNSVRLAEGPWPEKAYWDAHQQARKRAAGHYLNYGFTRPRVISQGEIDQFPHAAGAQGQRTNSSRGGERIETPTPIAEPPASDQPAPSGTQMGQRRTNLLRADAPALAVPARAPVETEELAYASPSTAWEPPKPAEEEAGLAKEQSASTPEPAEPFNTPTADEMVVIQTDATELPPPPEVVTTPQVAQVSMLQHMEPGPQSVRPNQGVSLLGGPAVSEDTPPRTNDDAQPWWRSGDAPNKVARASDKRAAAKVSRQVQGDVNLSPVESFPASPWLLLMLAFATMFAGTGVYRLTRRRRERHA